MKNRTISDFTIYILILAFVGLTSCKKDTSPSSQSGNFVLRQIDSHNLPDELTECSGIEMTGANQFWMHNDAGNSNLIFEVNATGQITKSIQLTGAENIDWEDLALDESGKLYVGNFGNNDNDRSNLAIYIVSPPSEIIESTYTPQVIYFSFEDQTQFPPDESEYFYDTEAFFVANGKVYLFIKDRSKPFIGLTKMYELPAAPGVYEATLIGTYNTSSKKSEGAITAADISPDGSIVALLSNDIIWLFTEFTAPAYLSGRVDQLSVLNNHQYEGIVFADDCTVYLTNERKEAGESQLEQFSICK